MKRKKTFPYEIIGEKVEVIESKNESHLGITGEVVDETKSTITINEEGKTKMIMKNNVTIKLLKTGQVVKGLDLVKRSEERIKG